MGPYTPPCSFYQFTQGTWVHFSVPSNFERPKRRGYIIAVDDVQALIIDEHTVRLQRYVLNYFYTDFTHSAQFNIDTHELEVSKSQAPSLPANTPVHPLIGKQVVVTHGQQRGYHGYIQVGNAALTVKLQALFTSPVSPHQNFAWHQLRLM